MKQDKEEIKEKEELQTNGDHFQDDGDEGIL